MAAKDQDDALREAARARGFRLVKSRRRKPGGDFGRYGLVGLDSGRECLGFGPDGLTATPEEVHDYLRGGEVASWKRSLISVVGESPSPPPKKAAAKQAEETEASARPERGRGTASEIEGREERTTSSPSAPSRRGDKAGKSSAPGSASAIAEGAESGPSSSDAEPQPLTIREATRRDAATLAKLTGIPAATLAERLAAAIGAGEPPLVALRGGNPVGLVAWTILSTLHEGPRGRITLLLVTERERRQGVGTALLQAAEQHLAEAGVTAAELLLDIDFDAPTALLRCTGWARATNGYGKEVG
ncbi:MAG TPA: GNAT family N-acetyltransferase [Allosphingosinicella sp.]|nr:GNAT family N-acetyltransferase [Allosphingosinicella sp.]